MTGNTLLSALVTAGKDTPNKPFATLPDGTVILYHAFFAGARRLAGTLSHQGLTPGDRVAAQVEKSICALQLYVATIMAGGVFLPLNPAYTTAEIAYFLNDASPVIFVVDPNRHEQLLPVAKNAGTQTILTLDAAGRGTLTDAAAAEPAQFTPVARAPSDLAAILYTSGTTGRSKGAMLSHRALVTNSKTLKTLWQFTADDVLIHALPIFHTHGLFVATNVALMAGAQILFHEKFDAGAVIRSFPAATAIMGVPTFYTRLLAHPDLSHKSTATMRLFISGSAPLLAETHAQWHNRTGYDILERYGLTETGMNTSNPLNGPRRAGTVGFPLPDVELKICDPVTGNTLPKGKIGMIEVRGPNVFSGYWQMPEKTAEDLRHDGFFITGDLGQIDDDGCVTIVGRTKDLIISGGFNVYPKEVESLLDSMDGVVETAVIGVPHPDFGEAVVAIVVTDDNRTITAKHVLSTACDRLAKYKHPKHIVFQKSLPRNTMGKVQKNLLRSQYAALFVA